MAGIKGRSGRKSWDKELQAKELWNLSIPVLKFALTSKKVSLNKKVDVALTLVNKMLPNKIEGEGFGNTFVGIWNNVSSKEKGVDDFGRIREQVTSGKV